MRSSPFFFTILQVSLKSLRGRIATLTLSVFKDEKVRIAFVIHEDLRKNPSSWLQLDMLRSKTGYSKSEKDQTKGVSYMLSERLGLEESWLLLRVEKHNEHGSSACTAYSKLEERSFKVLCSHALPVYRRLGFRWSKTGRAPKLQGFSGVSKQLLA